MGSSFQSIVPTHVAIEVNILNLFYLNLSYLHHYFWWSEIVLDEQS
jgi:hypothetical protein